MDINGAKVALSLGMKLSWSVMPEKSVIYLSGDYVRYYDVSRKSVFRLCRLDRFLTYGKHGEWSIAKEEHSVLPNGVTIP